MKRFKGRKGRHRKDASEREHVFLLRSDSIVEKGWDCGCRWYYNQNNEMMLWGARNTWIKWSGWFSNRLFEVSRCWMRMGKEEQVRTKRKMEFLHIAIMGKRSVSECRCCVIGLELTHPWVTKAAPVSDTFNTNTAHFDFLSWALTVGMNNAVLIWWRALSCWTPLDTFGLSLASRSFYSEVSACKTAVYLHSNGRQIPAPLRRPSRSFSFALNRWWIF